MLNNGDSEALVFNIQGYSVQDGPGIRTTVFLKGCPLRCQWCSNPESQTSSRDVMQVRTKCVKCYRCIKLCKNGAISFPKNTETEAFPVIDHAVCCNCTDHICVQGCYEDAIEDVGVPTTVSEVMDTLLADEPFFRQSGGGVTLSGGDPLQHEEFDRELFKQCRENCIHTAVETSGYVSWEKFKPVLDYTDLVLYDLKHIDPIAHKEFTGVSNELILRNLERILTETSVSVVVRVPVIPCANDSDDDMKAIAQFANKIGVREVDLMPYHRLGTGKYAGLGRTYPLGLEVTEPSKERIKDIQRIFQANHLVCSVGG
jgi:pyruvate formate lyase activating enzyme